MLACARIGAVHSVVFGGFSAEALRDRINDSECAVLITADGGYRRGSVLPLKRFADEAIAGCPSIQHVVVVRRRARRRGRRGLRHHEGGPRSLVAPAPRAGLARLPRRADGRRGDAVHPLYLGHHREAEGHRAHHRRLPHPGGRDHEVRVRPEGRRRLLVHRRHRLGHRPLLRGVRPARERRHGAHVRGRARLAGARPLLEDLRALRRDRLLHGADRDPRLHEVGHRPSRAPRPLAAAPARQRRRADQPRGLDLVPRAHRRQSLPHRRHLVADRDRRDHDHAAARRRHHQARQRHDPLPRHHA